MSSTLHRAPIPLSERQVPTVGLHNPVQSNQYPSSNEYLSYPSSHRERVEERVVVREEEF
jgi:hypothetical protein